MDLTLADEVLNKTLLDFAKNVSRKTMRVPKTWAAHCCGSAFPENGLAFRQNLDEVGNTLVDW